MRQSSHTDEGQSVLCRQESYPCEFLGRSDQVWTGIAILFAGIIAASCLRPLLTIAAPAIEVDPESFITDPEPDQATPQPTQTPSLLANSTMREEDTDWLLGAIALSCFAASAVLTYWLLRHGNLFSGPSPRQPVSPSFSHPSPQTQSVPSTPSLPTVTIHWVASDHPTPLPSQETAQTGTPPGATEPPTPAESDPTPAVPAGQTEPVSQLNGVNEQNSEISLVELMDLRKRWSLPHLLKLNVQQTG